MKKLTDLTSERMNVSELMTAKEMSEITGGDCTGGWCTGGLCTGGTCTGGMCTNGMTTTAEQLSQE